MRFILFKAGDRIHYLHKDDETMTACGLSMSDSKAYYVEDEPEAIDCKNCRDWYYENADTSR